MSLPLRYKICQWPQAAKCLSNNSRQLIIKVIDLCDYGNMLGTLIEVVHLHYGTLFAAIPEGKGEIISDKDDKGNELPWMTTEEILKQLLKFGFDITYTERLTLNDDTLAYLMYLRNLGFDKITRIAVMHRTDNNVPYIKTYPLAFKSEHADMLINYGMKIVGKQFNDLLANNWVINLAEKDNYKLSWNWIDATYGIDTILEENSDIEDMQAWLNGEEIDPNRLLAAPSSYPAYPQMFTPYDENEEYDTPSSGSTDNSGG